MNLQQDSVTYTRGRIVARTRSRSQHPALLATLESKCFAGVAGPGLAFDELSIGTCCKAAVFCAMQICR